MEAIYISSAQLEKGMVQIYTGNGKGKSTAAFGLALRAAGQGLQVEIIQFMKTGQDYGEVNSLAKIPNVRIRSYGCKGFIYRDGASEEDRRLAGQALAEGIKVINNNSCSVLILDEINNALSYNLISLAEVLQLVDEKPDNMELVLTGRDAHPALIEKAQLVTEMKEIKHPYKQGIGSRRGIEY